MANCNAIVVIPARLASTRLPNKLLLRESGRTLIEHTYRAACKSKLASQVIVATDHPSILEVVRDFGGEACLTDPNANSGTDRVAEVASSHGSIDIFVNVQGDEPEIDPASIDLVIERLQVDDSVSLATLATPIRDRERLNNPNCVKVVCDHQGRALYFSRSPIPFAREWDDAMLDSQPPLFLQHIGLYGYRRSFLQALHSLPPSSLEVTEKLEQLRFLQDGHQMAVLLVDHSVAGIDVRADYDAFLKRQLFCSDKD